MKFITPRRVIIFGLIILVGLISWRIWENKNKAKAAIKTVAVVRKDVISQLVASGKIVADRTATLNFPISGKLGFINVKADDTVKAFQTLAGMDVADLDTSISTAWYAYLAADAAAKKAEDEVKGHDADETFTQKNTRVAAQTTRDAAYDAWKSAVRAKRNSYLVAPFAGVVTNVSISAAGDTIGVTDGITIIDPMSLRFLAEIDETDVGKIYLGQKVMLKLDAFADREISATVEHIAFSATTSDSGGTVYGVNIKPNEIIISSLRVGMNGSATMVLDKAVDVLALPIEAVVDGEIIISGKVKKKVVTGMASDVDVEIKSGLSEGEKVWLPQ